MPPKQNRHHSPGGQQISLPVLNTWFKSKTEFQLYAAVLIAPDMYSQTYHRLRQERLVAPGSFFIQGREGQRKRGSFTESQKQQDRSPGWTRAPLPDTEDQCSFLDFGLPEVSLLPALKAKSSFTPVHL